MTDVVPEAGSRRLLLSAYDAKRCPRRLHNEWDATIPKTEWELPADAQLRVDEGLAFEELVLGRLRVALGPGRYVDVSATDGRTAAVGATLAAMAAGAEVVIGGWLPDDVGGARKGRPDLLVRDGDGYVPGEVKGHLMTKVAKRGSLRWSSLADPAAVQTASGRDVRTTQRFDDFLQLAHYWRMLEACGHAAAVPRGFVIGTDNLPQLDQPGPDQPVPDQPVPDQPVHDQSVPDQSYPSAQLLVWHDLDAQVFTTYSRSRGTTKRSALERYDHEHGFRRQVAETAAARTGAVTDPQPIVVPIFTEECNSCPWYDLCLGVAGADTASAHISTGALSRREWLALDRLGYASLATLASLDPDDEQFLAAYLPEVTHLPNARERLAGVVRRVRMIKDGVEIERTTTGPIGVPRADIEVDLDIEWGVDQRVYLWGALVRRPGTAATYQPFVTWGQLDAAGEHALAAELMGWLRALVDEARQQSQTVRVYHYSAVEVTHLKRVLGAATVQDLVPLFVDLHAIVAEHFFGAHGLGIKKVAPQFGFGWRDEEPSGLQSQLWLQEAQDPADPTAAADARTRLLEYNEDDVAATAALREGLAALG